MASPFVENPVLLLSYHEGTREFKLSPEGRAILYAVESPLAIVGVAGMYRTGKSYLLNRVLLDRKYGFGVGPTVNPCTKGIWIWGTPINGRTLDGAPCNVIILDTEGIGALDQDTDHDSRIFSLTILIVSCFLYNSRGSIDEEALNSLSLVVNLTKNIQIKSKNSEEVGVEDYAPYFPSFVWVVRDFALKLVDSDGEPLTAKGYLEKALNAQKGFSDLAEEKNRIRRLLKEFFKDRDCCTLVRPVNNEKDLHNLENLEPNALRPEFWEGVRVLRGKVLNSVKTKMLNGRNLSGQMLVELIESYVSAVNKGAVPNIENAWNYICKNECGKAFEDSQQIYTKKVSELLEGNYPNVEDEVLEFHKTARRAAFSYFKERAIGEEAQRFCVKLKETFSEKWNQLRFQNDMDSEKQCLDFLKGNYNTINNKLKSNEYKSFLDYERELRTLQQYYKEHGPKGPQKEKLALQFCQTKLIESADIFMKNLNSEIEIMESAHAEQIRILEMDSNIVKEEIVKEKVELKKIVAIVENEKKELIAKDDALEKQLEEVKADKEKIEQELRAALKALKDESQREIEKVHKDFAASEQAKNELNKKLIQQSSEFKEKTALLEQKQAHLENTLEETKQREKDLDQENKNLVKSHQNSVKELQNKYEGQVESLNSKVQSEKTAKQSLEKELEELQGKYSELKNNFDSEIEKQVKRTEELSNQNKTLTQTLDSREKEAISKVRDLEKTIEEGLAKYKKQLDEQEKKTKKLEDSLRAELANLDKENAVKTQQNEFLETQVRELKAQLDEERKQHAMMLASLSSITDSSKNLELEFEALKAKHENQVKFIESQNEIHKKELLAEIEKLTQGKTDIELRYKLDSSEWMQKHENLLEDVNILNSEKEKLKESVAEYKSQYETLQHEYEERYKNRVVVLEKQVDETTEKLATEIQQEKKNAEKLYSQLKESYEAEKKRLEAKLQEEKEKHEKKVKIVTDDYEEKIKRDLDTYEEDLANKDQEYRELEIYLNEEINKFKNQASLDKQKIETLETYLKELKAQNESQERNYNHIIEQNIVRFNNERNTLQDKIDKITSEVSTKEKEIAMLGYQKEQTEQQYISKVDEAKELKIELDAIKNLHIKKYDELSESNRKLTEELISLKSDYKREVALIAQESEFKSARVVELERSLKDTEEKYRETMKIAMSEGQGAYTIEKLTADRDALKQKLGEKKKTMKQLQASFAEKASEQEKEKSGLTERIIALERMLAELEFKHALERDRGGVNESRLDLESTVANDEVDRLRSHIQDLEHELASNKNTFEREKLLWENKFKFLNDQRDSAKADLAEAQRKFEFTLQQLQKREQSGKEKQEGTLNSLVSSIESRYETKVKDLQDFSNSTIEHLNLKIKLLEQEIKGLKEELEITKRGKKMLNGSLDKRCKQLQEMESKLLNEIEMLRVEKEKKSKEIMEVSQLERDVMRGKMNEVERKVIEAENSKNQMYLELEKERSKWQMERDHLITAKNEAIENFEGLENKYEMVLRENERLKGDRVKSRILSAKRIETKTSSQAVGSPSKLQEFYSQRVDFDSGRNDSLSSYRKRHQED